MRRRSVSTLLFCGFCLLAAGCTTAESTSTDGVGTVKPEEHAASAVAQAPEAAGEQPTGEIQERAVPGLQGIRPSIVFPGKPHTGPVTIQSVSAEPCCNFPWYTPVVYKIQLTAPAPPAGFPVLLNINNLVDINFPFVIERGTPLQFTVPAGQQTWGLPLRFQSIPATAVVEINAVAGLGGPLTAGPQFTLLPPKVTAVTFNTGGVISGVPSAGQRVMVNVSLDSPAPFPDNGTLAYNVSYAAQGSGNYPTSGVTGPTGFIVAATLTMGQFPITVFPCHGQPCQVIVTVSTIPGPAAVNHPVQGILQVNP